MAKIIVNSKDKTVKVKNAHPYVQDIIKHLDAALEEMKKTYRLVDHPETKKELTDLANTVRNVSIKVTSLI